MLSYDNTDTTVQVKIVVNTVLKHGVEANFNQIMFDQNK